MTTLHRPLAAALLAVALNTSPAVLAQAASPAPVADIVYSALAPGEAKSSRVGNTLLLANNTVEAAWTLEGGKLYLTGVRDRASGDVIAQRSEVFEITLDKVRIPASACRLAEPPSVETIPAHPGAARLAERIRGCRLNARFIHPATGATVRWRAELRDGSHYFRQIVSIESQKGVLTQVRALAADIGPARIVGSAAAGNPVCSDHHFIGMEQPMSRNNAGDATADAGSWSPEDMEGKAIVRPLSGLRSGPMSVKFAYDRGNHRLDIVSVRLVVNGKTVAEDKHVGWSGGSSESNSYNLVIPAGIDAGELHVVLGGPEDATNSFGKISLSQGAFGATGGGASTCDLPCKLDLTAGKPYTFSAVLGLYPEGQLRRAFLRYLERERAAPYRQFLHYNGWFDFDQNVAEQTMIDTIAAYDREFIKKRGVPVKAFVIDDGWDDWKAGFWTINKKKFPNDFRKVGEELRRVGSRFGIWISPLAGYGGSCVERTKLAAKEGLTPNGTNRLDLSYRPYYDWYLKKTAGLVKDDKVAYFKFDNAGNGVNPHFLSLLDICSELRRHDPNLVINITVGTWPSPFWLNHIDCTWRGDNDMGWEGFGDDREKWITYRDAQTWRGVVSKGPLYPLNSIMNHGVVLSNGHKFATRAYKAGTDMKHEVRSFFGSGTLMQELYVKPAITPPAAWDAIAEAAKWSAAHADILADTHWIGGDPSKGANVYGWAAWAPRKAVLTLRNPSNEEKTYSLDIAKAFELPSVAAKKYTVKGAYADTPAPFATAEAGKPETITLKPLDVLVLEFTPVR